MTGKGLDFKHKEVVNINTGKRLGYVQDVCADLNTGSITSIIVPGESKLASMFSNKNDIVIPCGNITKVCRYNKAIQFCKSTKKARSL